MPFRRGPAPVLAAIGGARRLARNERGISIVELAIAAPVLAIMIVGVADLGRGFLQRYSLQQAANRTMELARQGTTGSNYTHLIPEAAAAANVPLANVTGTQWLECTSGATTTIKAFDSFCDSGQAVARFVRISIWATFTPIFGTAGYGNVQSDGTVRIEAMSTLRVQ